MSSEKASNEVLPAPGSVSAPRKSRMSPRQLILGGVGLAALYACLPLLTDSARTIPGHFSGCHQDKQQVAALLSEAKCPAQPSPRNIGQDWNPLTDASYCSLAGERLSKAVQHRTESFDSFIYLEPNDPALDKHYAFADWLKSEYSAVFTTLKHEVVNYHGHLLTWQGKQPDLQPILLMAHTDTVPVINETLGQWTYPPFSGTVAKDGDVEYVWGRGASDCKNSLLGILGALEKLVQEGYQPERTVIVSSGFDEEIGGTKGAQAISAILEDRYGHNSIAFAFDEGFDGLSQQYGSLIASFGMAEKGSVNAVVKVETPGGHSSVPPPHTGIGLLSLLLAELEDKPFQPSLEPSSPYLKWLNCVADYAPDFPKHVARKVKHPRYWYRLAKELAASDRRINSVLSTTQAIDLIKGGVKVNALPEVVEATVNHRIAFSSSVNETLTFVASRLVPLAKSLGLSIDAFGTQHQPKNGKPIGHVVLLQQGEHGLEPAPISPTDSKAFELMAGTVKHVFGPKTIVAPSGMYANTDTRTVWNLTKNIYRFTPALVEQNLNVHTVDERISLSGHLNTTRFFYKLIRNAEGWESE